MTYSNFGTLNNTKDVSVQWSVEIVHWRLSPSSRVETPLST